MWRWILPLGGLVVLLVLSSVSVFSTRAESMMPAVQPGQRFIVNKLAYGYNTVSLPIFGPHLDPQRLLPGQAPVRGDVIVFLDTMQAPSRTILTRVVAIAGDEVAYQDGRLVVNGEAVLREQVGVETYTARVRPVVVTRYRETLPGGHVHDIFEQGDQEFLDQVPPVTVPEGRVFVLGDNRDMSRDSRARGGPGLVPLTRILGRVSD
ncbi:hypothetical protein AWH62_11100 [Maricaulis sp. W15]|uniref:signal peptidase I n=1 Tax=Maricaulis sp. W15 TaxID=1772333 RepID=UPI0009490E2F|nr:signal peptidase I [Maricaulis sp. W15]OLF72369.1 hypothetical protein AWH62_11100 [Maricaulis sp. W15]